MNTRTRKTTFCHSAEGRFFVGVSRDKPHENCRSRQFSCGGNAGTFVLKISYTEGLVFQSPITNTLEKAFLLRYDVPKGESEKKQIIFTERKECSHE